MLQVVGIREGDSVLDVACGGGYSSAIVAQLARAVVAVEEEAALALAAKDSLYALGISNVSVETGPLAAGYAGRAPYDVIVLQGATEVDPILVCGHCEASRLTGQSTNDTPRC